LFSTNLSLGKLQIPLPAVFFLSFLAPFFRLCSIDEFTQLSTAPAPGKNLDMFPEGGGGAFYTGSQFYEMKRKRKCLDFFHLNQYY
jgi:hypothetical protein